MSSDIDLALIAKLREAASNGAEVPQLLAIMHSHLDSERGLIINSIRHFRHAFDVPLIVATQIDLWPSHRSEEEINALVMPYVKKRIGTQR